MVDKWRKDEWRIVWDKEPYLRGSQSSPWTAPVFHMYEWENYFLFKSNQTKVHLCLFSPCLVTVWCAGCECLTWPGAGERRVRRFIPEEKAAQGHWSTNDCLTTDCAQNTEANVRTTASANFILYVVLCSFSVRTCCNAEKLFFLSKFFANCVYDKVSAILMIWGSNLDFYLVSIVNFDQLL